MKTHPLRACGMAVAAAFGLTLVVGCTSSPAVAGSSALSATTSSTAQLSSMSGSSGAMTTGSVYGGSASSGGAATSAPTSDTLITKPSRTTPVAPPGGTGNISATVSAGTPTTAATVPLTGSAKVGTITTNIVKIATVDITGSGPGETSGPGVTITLRVTNSSEKAVSLANVGVEVTGKSGVPGVQVAQAGAVPFIGDVAPGKTAEGSYVFRLDTAEQKPLTVAVNSFASAPTVLFVGDPS